jgi:hypothetical protein
VLGEDLSYSGVLERSSFSVVLGREDWRVLGFTVECWDLLLSVGKGFRCCRVLERR